MRSRSWSGMILALISALACCGGCERRLVRKEEKPFMEWSERNWRKLTPQQKANYYEMIDRQKERARREGLTKENRSIF